MDFYKSQLRAWDRNYKTGENLWQGPVAFEFPFEGKMRVLELGCGNGKTFSGILNSSCIATAIDFSPNAVEICRQMAKDWGNAEVLVADARELPFKDNSFDAVVAFHILGHLLEEDRKKAASEVKRILVPGGRAYVQVFSRSDMRFGNGKEMEEGTFVRGTGIACHYFDEKELDALFKGFRKISSERFNQRKNYNGKEMRREKITAVYEK